MILLRARTYGSDEWDEISFAGDREGEFLSLLAELLLDRNLHVQFRAEGAGWESL